MVLLHGGGRQPPSPGDAVSRSSPVSLRAAAAACDTAPRAVGTLGLMWAGPFVWGGFRRATPGGQCPGPGLHWPRSWAYRRHPHLSVSPPGPDTGRGRRWWCQRRAATVPVCRSSRSAGVSLLESSRHVGLSTPACGSARQRPAAAAAPVRPASAAHQTHQTPLCGPAFGAVLFWRRMAANPRLPPPLPSATHQETDARQEQ